MDGSSDETMVKGLGGTAPHGVVDLRPTPVTPTRSTGPRSAVVTIVILILIGVGVWSVVGQGDNGVLWPGVAAGVIGMVLLVLRMWVRRTLGDSSNTGTAARIASGEQLDAAGVPMFISAFSRASSKRNDRWTDGELVPGRLLGILSLGRSNQFRSQVYLEVEYEVGGQRYWGASGESVVHANAGVLRPDGEIVVRVDPAHPARVAVDWTQTMRAPDAR